MLVARFLLLALGVFALTSSAASWQSSLAQMPLVERAPELNRTNCVRLMLASFRSNDVVKALVFMPGATDEFYMFRRARAAMNRVNPTLFDAVVALTNQTLIRVTFQPPLLLLHTDEDPLKPMITIAPPELQARLEQTAFPAHVLFDDRDWNYLQPILRKSLHASVLPWVRSFDSWHFYRHSFAGWNLNGLEAIRCVTMAGKSKASISKSSALSWHRFVLRFEPDERVRATPKLEAFPR